MPLFNVGGQAGARAPTSPDDWLRQRTISVASFQAHFALVSKIQSQISANTLFHFNLISGSFPRNVTRNEGIRRSMPSRVCWRIEACGGLAARSSH